MKKLTLNQAQTKVLEVSKGKWSFTSTEYETNKATAKFLCEEHGEFESSYFYVVKSNLGCVKCKKPRVSHNKLTPEQAYNSINTLENLSFPKFFEEYKGTQHKISCLCAKHGSFEKSVVQLRSGNLCPRCGIENFALSRRLPFDEFVTRSNVIHDNKYTYIREGYQGSNFPIRAICSTHGEFTVSGDTHLQGGGECKVCSTARRSLANVIPFSEALARFTAQHKDRYTYCEDSYTSISSSMDIRCSIHGIFNQLCNDHAAGSNCPSCAGRGSEGQRELAQFLKELLPDTEILEDYIYNISNSKREVDIFIPSLNLAFEYNGVWWHSSKFIPNTQHHLKHKELQLQGIRLIQIFSDEWLGKKLQCKSLIKSMLLKSTDSIHARKLKIIPIANQEAVTFHNEYHIQGWNAYGDSYALVDGSDIKAVMTFKSSSTYENTQELTRYSSKVRVKGGASKLLSHFRGLKLCDIVSFSDNRLFTGSMYKSLGFKNNGLVPPSYTYVTQAGKLRHHKFKFRHERLISLLGTQYNPELTERENCEGAGYFQVWDCGLTRWKYTND